EAAPGPEAVADEPDGALDAAFFMGLFHVAGSNGEAAAAARVFEKASVEACRLRRVRQDDGLHVVEDARSRATAEERKGAIHAAQERAHRLTDGELDVQIAGVRECRDERADPSRTARQRVSE